MFSDFCPLGGKQSLVCCTAANKWEQKGEDSLFNKTCGFQPLKISWDFGCGAKPGQGRAGKAALPLPEGWHRLPRASQLLSPTGEGYN